MDPNAMQSFTSISFLMSLSEGKSRRIKLKFPFVRNTQCTEADQLPDAICHYESSRFKFNFDLNLRPQEELASRLLSDYSDIEPAEAKVTLYKWTRVDTNDENELIHCFR